MTRIVGVFILLFGLLMFALGAFSLLATVSALATGKTLPAEGNPAVFLGMGAAAIAYGWQCLKGFDSKK